MRASDTFQKFGEGGSFPPAIYRFGGNTIQDEIVRSLQRILSGLGDRISVLEKVKPAFITRAGKTVVAPYVVADGDEVILANAAAILAVTLPLAVQSAGRVITVKRINAAAFVVNVTCQGADLCDGLAVQPLAVQWAWITVWSDGVAWYIIG